MTTREVIEEILKNSERRFGIEDSFGELQNSIFNIVDSLKQILELKNKNALPRISLQENRIIEISLRSLEGLVTKIKEYPGQNQSKRDDIRDVVLKLEHEVVPLCRTILASPETANSLIRAGKDIEDIKNKLNNEFVNNLKGLNEAVSGLKKRLFEDAANILGDSFHKTAKSSARMKWIWLGVIIFGILFFYCEAVELAGKINLFIEQGKTSYEIIFMIILERAALILLPTICIYFGMKQFNALSHIQVQNNHKGNIGDVFAKIYKASEGNEILNAKVGDLLVKLAEEYTDGYIDSGGIKIKKITTPLGEIDANS